MWDEARIGATYEMARDRFRDLEVDSDKALERLGGVALSINCWQGDDVRGFENAGGALDGGLAVTGAYPGAARNAEELRSDLEQALRLIPGRHRVNLHSLYAETNGGKVERNALEPEHFSGWVQWAAHRGLGLDFNPSFFAHPLAAGGLTLTHPKRGVRRFWIEHGAACRRIGASMGKALGSAAVTNVWIPDGFKDAPADRKGYRERLIRSLDTMFSERLNPRCIKDSVEGKLFGIGSESFVAGSHEFYLGYAASRRILLCLDTGHFHPTESVADKISAVLPWVEGLLLHISRGVRWDSDHVPVLSDDLADLARELVRGGGLERVRLGLDFFDASINRVAAWVIGGRSVLKALLQALLEPSRKLRAFEEQGDFTSRLALMEALKTFPFGAVWDFFCLSSGVPADPTWLEDVRWYEKDVLSRRG